MNKYLVKRKIPFSFGGDYKETSWCGPHLKCKCCLKDMRLSQSWALRHLDNS